MPFKAIIIEDEPHSAKLLEGMLNAIDPQILVVDKCGDLPSGIKSIRKHIPHVVFLDIELPVYSGLQLFDFFDEDDINFKIIFTTAYNQYALRAFEMCAIDYLMKPLQESKLRLAVNKISNQNDERLTPLMNAFRQNFSETADKKIVLPVSDGYEIINLNDIIYLKAEGSYTNIFLKANTCLLASKNLKHFQFILEGASNFFRIHRSIIVNINFVKKLYRNEGAVAILANNDEVPVAVDRIDDLLNVIRNI